MGDELSPREKRSSGHKEPDKLFSSDALLPLVYAELKRLAAAQLTKEHHEHTLTATALVHEAYVRLTDANQKPIWDSRGHFFASAAEAMRRILVERARKRKRLKHGGRFQRQDLKEFDAVVHANDDRLLAIDEALTRFAMEDPTKAELVKLRYFAGLTIVEAAEVLGISRTTASRYWEYSRAWLLDALSDMQA